jgi:cytoskeletal protein CcmA (bactofilin family)
MAWKRDDYPPQPEQPSTPSRPAAAGGPAPDAPRSTGRATIGPSIFIKGDLTGEEDLVIDGRVEGKVDLKQNNVTIGKDGRVRADIFGRVVTVEGEVDGNVFAREQAVLRQSGAVRGNLTAPRVTLEDGSRFKGTIDMEPKDLPKGGQQQHQQQHHGSEPKGSEPADKGDKQAANTAGQGVGQPAKA